MFRNKGFTLIEVIIVATILAIMVGIIAPFVVGIVERGNVNFVSAPSFSVPLRDGGFGTQEVPPVVTIDNCEYFYVPVPGCPGYVLTHKGDCSTCRDMMTSKIKEALNVGKAEAISP